MRTLQGYDRQHSPAPSCSRFCSHGVGDEGANVQNLTAWRKDMLQSAQPEFLLKHGNAVITYILHVSSWDTMTLYPWPSMTHDASKPPSRHRPPNRIITNLTLKKGNLPVRAKAQLALWAVENGRTFARYMSEIWRTVPPKKASSAALEGFR